MDTWNQLIVDLMFVIKTFFYIKYLVSRVHFLQLTNLSVSSRNGFVCLCVSLHKKTSNMTPFLSLQTSTREMNNLVYSCKHESQSFNICVFCDLMATRPAALSVFLPALLLRVINLLRLESHRVSICTIIIPTNIINSNISRDSTFFQIGTFAFSWVMQCWIACWLSLRWGDEIAITTLASPTFTHLREEADKWVLTKILYNKNGAVQSAPCCVHFPSAK